MLTRFSRSAPTELSIFVDAATRIQVLGRMADLPGAEKDQCGAFIVRFLLFSLCL
jgi:hypothetical protein